MNALRGAVIGEDGEPMVVLGLADGPAKNGWARGHVKMNECYRESDAVSAWYAVGKPACWCYPRQCHADVDGLYEGNPTRGGAYYVGIADISLLATAWQVKEPDFAVEPYPNGIVDVPNGACADINHNYEGNFTRGGAYYVGIFDITDLANAWQRKEIPFNDDQDPIYPNGVPADCIGSSVELDPVTGQPGTSTQ